MEKNKNYYGSLCGLCGVKTHWNHFYQKNFFKFYWIELIFQETWSKYINVSRYKHICLYLDHLSFPEWKTLISKGSVGFVSKKYFPRFFFEFFCWLNFFFVIWFLFYFSIFRTLQHILKRNLTKNTIQHGIVLLEEISVHM